jgi:hypothetical protein
MIKYFFIIDFYENVELDMPVLKRKDFTSVVEQAKQRIVTKAKNSDGLIEKISDRSKRYHLYAKANDENLTVCIVTDENDAIKDQVWSLIKSIHSELKDFDSDKDKLIAKQEPIKRLITPFMEKDIASKINGATKKGMMIAQKVKDKGKKQAEDLLASLEVVEEADQEAVLMDEQASSVYNHYWWEEKKMMIMLAGIGLIVVVFLFAYLKLARVA